MCVWLNSPLFPCSPPLPQECVSSNSEMQNPLQSAQEKTAFEPGLYGYPYVRAPKKGRKSCFSASSPPPSPALGLSHLQVYQATGEPVPSILAPLQLPGLSAAPGKNRTRQHFQNRPPLCLSALPRAGLRTQAPWGFQRRRACPTVPLRNVIPALM